VWFWFERTFRRNVSQISRWLQASFQTRTTRCYIPEDGFASKSVIFRALYMSWTEYLGRFPVTNKAKLFAWPRSSFLLSGIRSPSSTRLRISTPLLLTDLLLHTAHLDRHSLPISEHWAWIHLTTWCFHPMLECSLNIQESSNERPILERSLSPINKTVEDGLHGPATLPEMYRGYLTKGPGRTTSLFSVFKR
jgi:hypothetical protein